jgi:O-methyltransferase involved in polyketide biosynthesis
MMCIRAKLIDNFIKDFLAKTNKSIVLHLGCGLDSRCNRIENSNTDTYDVDFKEVIDIRRYFYEETDNYHLIASSVIEPEWIEKIPKDEKHSTSIMVAGLFMYLKEDEIKTLIRRLKERIGSYTLIFDAFSVLTAKKTKKSSITKENWCKNSLGY